VKTVKPFGDINTATILVIGHDPRLQRSQAEASVAFFLDYLDYPCPTSRSEARKYDLAKALWEYINELADRTVPLAKLYVTNLCNELLEHTPGSGTVLIPDNKAQLGSEEIVKAAAAGDFKLILPMAVQPFYHLCRLGFLDEDSEVVKSFLVGARPRPDKAAESIYVQSGRAPFLNVCGQRFHHRGVPVIPVVHVKQWPLRPRMRRYAEPMQRAKELVQAALHDPMPGAIS
jgi:hypothetical protein